MITQMISIFTFHVKNMFDRQPKKKIKMKKLIPNEVPVRIN